MYVFKKSDFVTIAGAMIIYCFFSFINLARSRDMTRYFKQVFISLGIPSNMSQLQKTLEAEFAVRTRVLEPKYTSFSIKDPQIPLFDEGIVHSAQHVNLGLFYEYLTYSHDADIPLENINERPLQDLNLRPHG